MAVQAANVIDLQAYRQARARPAQAEQPGAVSFALQPVMMWVPYWGFVPMMVMGSMRHGA